MPPGCYDCRLTYEDAFGFLRIFKTTHATLPEAIIILHTGMVSIIICANIWVFVALIALLPHPCYPAILSQKRRYRCTSLAITNTAFAWDMVDKVCLRLLFRQVPTGVSCRLTWPLSWSQSPIDRMHAFVPSIYFRDSMTTFSALTSWISWCFERGRGRILTSLFNYSLSCFLASSKLCHYTSSRVSVACVRPIFSL